MPNIKKAIAEVLVVGVPTAVGVFLCRNFLTIDPGIPAYVDANYERVRENPPSPSKYTSKELELSESVNTLIMVDKGQKSEDQPYELVKLPESPNISILMYSTPWCVPCVPEEVKFRNRVGDLVRKLNDKGYSVAAAVAKSGSFDLGPFGVLNEEELRGLSGEELKWKLEELGERIFNFQKVHEYPTFLVRKKNDDNFWENAGWYTHSVESLESLVNKQFIDNPIPLHY